MLTNFFPNAYVFCTTSNTQCTVTEEGFYAFFNQFGPVIDSIVMVDRLTKRSRGFGFVTFANAVSLSLVYTYI